MNSSVRLWLNGEKKCTVCFDCDICSLLSSGFIEITSIPRKYLGVRSVFVHCDIFPFKLCLWLNSNIVNSVEMYAKSCFTKTMENWFKIWNVWKSANNRSRQLNIHIVVMAKVNPCLLMAFGIEFLNWFKSQIRLF